VIQITPQMRILVAIEAVDGRKGIDSLARLCQEKLQADPFSGCLFVFRPARRSASWFMTAKVSGWRKSASKGRFLVACRPGGRPATPGRAQLLLAVGARKPHCPGVAQSELKVSQQNTCVLIFLWHAVMGKSGAIAARRSVVSRSRSSGVHSHACH
jgi:hypothetical protein